MFIFLDESGDLGFDREKNNSKYFTITLLVCDDRAVLNGIKKAVSRTLKNKINHKSKKRYVEELKGTDTTLANKKYFLGKMPATGWDIYSITVNKSKVHQHLATKIGKKKLYNFLAKEIIATLPSDAEIDSVNLVVDKCKNKSEQSDFNQYIESYVLGHFSLKTIISIRHDSSKENLCLQAVDLFCWGLQRKAERQDVEWFNCFQEKIKADIAYLGK